jgi:hypothetical protein
MLVVFTTSVIAAGKVVLVGSGTPDPKDATLIEHLEDWGFTVEPHAADLATHPVAVDGVVLVFISESTSSANLLGAYRDSTVPVVNAEGWTYDDMDFAPDGTFNSDEGDTLKIVKDHPITAGFPDEVKIHESPIAIISGNDFQGDVEILAVRADMEEFAAISVYESGAKTISGATQARHVNIFPHSTAWDVITADGWKLIENSVLYAMGQLTPVSEKGKLAATWGQLKSY